MAVSIQVLANSITRIGIAHTGDRVYNYGPSQVWFGANEVQVQPANYASSGWSVAPNASIVWPGPDNSPVFVYSPQAAFVSIGASGAPAGPGMEWRYLDLPFTDPGVGNPFSSACPNNLLWEVVLFKHIFTTSAVVANRQLVFRTRPASSPAGNFFTSYQVAAASQPASVSNNYIWTTAPYNGPTGAIATPANTIQTPIAQKIILFPGDIIELAVGNPQGGDAFAQLNLVVREYQQFQANSFT